jgi:hypothetical protein
MDIADYAKPALYIAQYHCLHRGGNLSLTQKVLERLSASNSEDARDTEIGHGNRSGEGQGNGQSHNCGNRCGKCFHRVVIPYL